MKHPVIGNQAYEDVGKIMRSGKLSDFRATLSYHLGGNYVRRLEHEFAKKFNAKYAITFNSATAALHAAVIACSIGKGDEVIVTPYSFVSSASCVLMAGATPVFADVDPDTFCLDPKSVQQKITSRTKAILPVHLCGNVADMDGILSIASVHNLKIIEDAAQAIGAVYHGHLAGHMGDCGIFSFNQSKTISTGEGGMLITDNYEIADKCRAIRNHGEVSQPDMKLLGYNFRMCEIEAAIGLEQFKRLDKMNAQRIALCNRATELISDIKGLTPPFVVGGNKHVYYTYAVKVDKRQIGIPKDILCEMLCREGVFFGNYVKPLHLLPIFGGSPGQLPVVERLWQEELIVTDIFRPPMKLKEVEPIIKKIRGVIYP